VTNAIKRLESQYKEDASWSESESTTASVSTTTLSDRDSSSTSSLILEQFYNSTAFRKSNMPWIYTQLLGTVILALGQIFKALEDLTVVHGIYHYFIIVFLVAIILKVALGFVKLIINLAATDDLHVLQEICESESALLRPHQRPHFQTVLQQYRRKITVRDKLGQVPLV
jgi:hypothetical protein